MQILKDLDADLFLKINGLGNPVLDYVLAWPTFLGETLILYAIVLTLMLIWEGRREGFKKFSWVLAGMLTERLVVTFLKEAIGRERPYTFFEDAFSQGLVNINYILGFNLSERSFPSGHAALSFAVAFLLNRLYGPKLRFTYLIAAWIALTRIYVGAHFPSDTIGGALIGLATAWAVARWLSYDKWCGMWRAFRNRLKKTGRPKTEFN